MGLHPMFDDSELPYCLRRPLIFGNMAQRQALNDLEIRIERILKKQALIEQGHLKLYTVEIKISGYTEIEVYAADEQHALEVADEKASIDDFDSHSIEIESTGIIRKFFRG